MIARLTVAVVSIAIGGCSSNSMPSEHGSRDEVFVLYCLGYCAALLLDAENRFERRAAPDDDTPP